VNKNNKGYKMRQKVKKNLKKQNTSLMYVSVKDNNIERALREFKKRVKNSNLLKELREREYYEKKSAKNRKMKKMKMLKIKSLQKD
jgi:ribosomal protein S21